MFGLDEVEKPKQGSCSMRQLYFKDLHPALKKKVVKKDGVICSSLTKVVGGSKAVCRIQQSVARCLRNYTNGHCPAIH